MANLGQAPGKKSLKMVKVGFKLPYYTHWGQSILVCGSEPALGSWNVKQGLILSPFHRGGELVWWGRIAVPSGFVCEYSYYLVDDDRNVLRWEGGKKRRLILPEGIKEGEVTEFYDLWQVLLSFLFCFNCFLYLICHFVLR